MRSIVGLAILVVAAFIAADEAEAVSFALQPATKSFNCDSVSVGSSPFDVADDACLLRTSPAPYWVTSKGAVGCAVPHLDRSEWDTACEDREKAAADIQAVSFVQTEAGSGCGHSQISSKVTCPSDMYQYGASTSVVHGSAQGCTWFCKCYSCFGCTDNGGKIDVLAKIEIVSSGTSGVTDSKQNVDQFIATRMAEASTMMCEQEELGEGKVPAIAVGGVKGPKLKGILDLASKIPAKIPAGLGESHGYGGKSYDRTTTIDNSEGIRAMKEDEDAKYASMNREGLQRIASNQDTFEATNRQDTLRSYVEAELPAISVESGAPGHNYASLVISENKLIQSSGESFSDGVFGTATCGSCSGYHQVKVAYHIFLSKAKQCQLGSPVVLSGALMVPSYGQEATRFIRFNVIQLVNYPSCVHGAKYQAAYDSKALQILKQYEPHIKRALNKLRFELAEEVLPSCPGSSAPSAPSCPADHYWWCPVYANFGWCGLYGFFMRASCPTSCCGQ